MSNSNTKDIKRGDCDESEPKEQKEPQNTKKSFFSFLKRKKDRKPKQDVEIGINPAFRNDFESLFGKIDS